MKKGAKKNEQEQQQQNWFEAHIHKIILKNKYVFILIPFILYNIHGESREIFL